MLLAFLLAGFVLTLLSMGLVTYAGIAAYRYYSGIRDDLKTPTLAVAAVANYGGAQIYDRTGKPLYRFPDETGGIRLPVRLDDVSPALIAATVSTEDATFWTNPGVEIRATARAAVDNVRYEGGVFGGRGGSGITQQLAKLTLIPPEERYKRSPERKLREAIYALEIGRQYDKTQVLEWYLNAVNYGGMYDGIETAARGYFGIHAKDLDLAQASMLAGIPQSPVANSPYLNPEGAKRRQRVVLDLMVRHGSVTAEEADAAARQPLRVQQLDESLPLRAPWFVEHVREELIARFGEHCFRTCGLEVITTLDLSLQEQAATILGEHLAKHGDPVGVHNGALVSIDARNGEVLVMVGSRRYDDTSPAIQGNNNFATAIQQPGSAFKPFVYLSLFKERGYGPESVIWDEAFTTKEGYKCENPGIVGKTFGPIPVRLALGSSLNCAANRAAAAAGVKNVIATGEAMGLTSLGDPGQYGASIATGGANVTLLDLAYAYTTLARGGSMIGMRHDRDDGLRDLDPAVLLSVRDATGRELFRYSASEQQVVPASSAYLVTNIISDCATRRLIWGCDFPGFRLFDDRPVAVKTGTQQAFDLKYTQANWQFMYTPQLVTGGWVGNADRTSWLNVSGSANAVGFSVRDLTNAVLQAYEIPPASFERPSDVVSVPVYVLDRSRGPIIGCGRKQPGLFARGTQPDINNRVCVDGRVRVPTEQLGTGGLGPYVPDVVMLPVTSEVMFMSPVARSQVSGRVTVVARPMGTDVRPYRIEWGAGASPTVWTPLITARQPGGTFLLATWDTSALPPGAYSLRVVRADGSLPTAAAAFETVTVGAPVMLPLTGLPISGTR